MVHENVAIVIHGRLEQTTLSVSGRTGLTFARQFLIHLKNKTKEHQKIMTSTEQNISKTFKDIERHKLFK